MDARDGGTGVVSEADGVPDGDGATTVGVPADGDDVTDRDGDEDTLVSVVLPTRGRRPAMFREAVASVAAQTYDPVELVVVDDSPDGISRALEADPPDGTTVRTIRDGDHDGPGDARNAGIRAASGPLLAFVDDDDTWVEEKLDRQVAALRAGGPDVGVVYTGLELVRDGDVVGVRLATIRGDVTRDVFAGRPLGTFSTLLVRASAVEAAGLVDPRFPYLEDREWCLRLSRHCEFEAVPEPMVRYRHGDHDQLTDDYEALRDVAYPLFVDKHRPTAAEFGSAWERKLVAALSRTVAAAALGAGRYGDALRFAVRALRHDPTHSRSLAQVVAAMGGPLTYRSLRTARRSVGRLRRAFGERVEFGDGVDRGSHARVGTGEE